MHRVAAVLLLALVAVASGAPALAQPLDSSIGAGQGGSVDSSGSTTSSGGQVTVGASGPDGPGVGAGADPCRYTVGPPEVVEAVIGSSLPGSPIGDAGPGDTDPADPLAADGEEPTIVIEPPWVVVQCPTSYSGGAIVDVFQLGDPPPPAGMLEAAQRALRIPLPDTTFSPAAADFQVVGIETWLWMEPEDTVPLTATACLPPADYACATVVAVFDTIVADMGDGAEVVDCDGPGIAYDSGVEWVAQLDADNCGYLYIDPSEDAGYPVTVTSVWSLTWSCAYDSDLDGVREAVCGGGALGAVGRTAGPVLLEVREYQAVATVAD